MKSKDIILSIVVVIGLNTTYTYAGSLTGIVRSLLSKPAQLLLSKRGDCQCNHLVATADISIISKILLTNDDLSKVKEELANIPWLPFNIERMLGNKIVSSVQDQILDRTKFKYLYQVTYENFNIVMQGAQSLAKKQGSQIPTDFTIFIYDSDEINAFSIPGRYIFVSKKLARKAYQESLRKENSTYTDTLRFTLAHELSHNLKRHYTFRVQSTVLNGINDLSEFFQLLNSMKSGKFRLMGNSYKPSPLFSKSNKRELINNIKQVKENLENSFNLFLIFFVKGLQEEAKIKEHTRNLYTIQEKEADACAIKILYYSYNGDVKKLKQTIANFESIISMTEISIEPENEKK